jgi:hypothetical protein
MRSELIVEVGGKVHWSGIITAIQPRAWVWRYRMDNRTHHLTGFNVWLDGKAEGVAGRFSVAISAIQQAKLAFQRGDLASGTAWPVQGKKREVVDLYRAGALRLLKRPAADKQPASPPFTGLTPAMEVYERRGCRMLDSKLWVNACLSCIWANRSRVEIEYNFGTSKRYRDETFCYGPRSCPLYEMGEPRLVPYKDASPSVDDGWMDETCIGGRGSED